MTDYELIVWTRSTGRTDEFPPEVQVFRRAPFLKRLAKAGWHETELEILNSKLDRKEPVWLFDEGAWINVVEFSVHERTKIELGNGQDLHCGK